MDRLAGRDKDFVDWATDGAEHRSRLEGVVSHTAGETQTAHELRLLNEDHLYVGHLILGNGERSRRIRLGLGGGIGSHLGFRLGRPRSAAVQDERSAERGKRNKRNL